MINPQQMKFNEMTCLSNVQFVQLTKSGVYVLTSPVPTTSIPIHIIITSTRHPVKYRKSVSNA